MAALPNAKDLNSSPRLNHCLKQRRLLTTVLAAGACLLLIVSFPAQGTVLWYQSGPVFVFNNGGGEDILHGAIKPQDTNSSSTLYFKFRVDPIADSATKSLGDFEAGFVLVEKHEEHLGLGSSRVAWAYCAMNVPKSVKGYVDLNSAAREPGYNWEYMRAGVPKNIAFKVEFVPGHDARITTWLNPDLSLGATEINQPTNIVTRFEAKATFDEIRLIHRGGQGGWKISQMVAGTSFEDLLVPHFWQRGWFMGLTAGVLLLAVAITVRLSERRRAQRHIVGLEQERAVAAERARIARDIHDEVGTSLTKISKLTEMMDLKGEGSVKNSAFTRSIANTARDTIQAMDEIVWAINPQNDTLKEMADYLVYFTEDFLRPTGVSGKLDVPLKLPDIPVTAEMRHNLFMVVKEALNNAVKHAQANEIRFGLNYSARILAVEISDNGRGFRLEEKTASGNGLENMRRRMSAIGGELKLQNEPPGHGTTVRLQVLLPESKFVAR